MKIIIVGDGKVGLALTEQLSRAGHDIVVIDQNPQVLEHCLESFDVMAVQGNGASMAVLEEAGVRDANLLIAATSSDEINILCCLVANKMAKIHTIARVRNPEYVDQLDFLKNEMGLSMTINPEMTAAQEIYHLLQLPSFLQRDLFAKGRVEIVKLKVFGNSRLNGRPLSELYQLMKAKVLVCAVERQGEAFIPNGSFVLQEGDNIHVTAASRDLSILVRNLGLMHDKIRKVIIIGGSRIAFYLSHRLLASGIGVKIIERNPARCVVLSTMLPKALIIEADGSRQDVLREEGINATDAVITLTDIDEENLIISMFAASLNVSKVVTKINRPEYIDTFSKLGVDTFINPKQLCCSNIVQYVRAMENTSGGSVQALHYIINGLAEALEFIATDTTKYRKKPLSELPLKPDLLIACILRGRRTIIPGGDDCIMENDTVIIVTTKLQTIYNLNDIFKD